MTRRQKIIWQQKLIWLIVKLFCVGALAVPTFVLYWRTRGLTRVLFDKGGSSGMNDTCQAMLTNGYLKNNQWKVDQCDLHVYSDRDVEHCLKTSANTSGRSHHIVFIGDSRLREQFDVFILAVRLGRKYDVFRAFREQWTHYYDKELHLHVEYVTDTHLTNIERFRNWAKMKPNDRPSLVVVGIGLWYTMDYVMEQNYGRQKYLEAAMNFANVIESLRSTTKFLWMSQAPVILPRVYDTSLCCDSTHKGPWFWRHISKPSYLRNDWLQDYNRIAKGFITNSSAYFWTSSRLIAHHYAFDLLDGAHLIPYYDDFVSNGLVIRAHVLLNLYCNKFMDCLTPRHCCT